MSRSLSKPVVSIVVVSYNCSEVISACISSCLTVPYTETIVVDNASKDGSAAIINSFGHHITFFEEAKNHGYTRGCNIGIEAARGEYIMLLNPDASLMPDTIEKLLLHFAKDEDLGAVAPTLVYPDGSFQNYTRTFPTVSGLAVEHFVPGKYQGRFKSFRQYLCLDVDFSVDQYVEQPAGAAIIFKNNGLLLDQSYCIYGSDVELCKNIIDAGYKIKQVTDAKVIHHQSKGGTNTPNLKLKTYLDLDNYHGMTLFFKRYTNWRNVIAYKLIFFSGLFLSIFPGASKGREVVKFRIKRLILFSKGESFFSYLKS